MTKYLILYRAPMTAAEQMSNSTPEEAQVGMDAWNAWASKAGSAIVDLGSPTQVVDAAGDTGDPIGGYSVLQAESAEHLTTVLEGHPHTAMGGRIETLECLSMPGM
jgi:hypothetical protein